jgi:carbon storage regulator
MEVEARTGNLVITRKTNESFIIGDNIKVTILDVGVEKVRVGIKAPKDVSVHRLEVYNAIQDERGGQENTI